MPLEGETDASRRGTGSGSAGAIRVVRPRMARCLRMKGDGSFKLVIGDEWHDSGVPSSGAFLPGAKTGFDPAGARGLLDMVVDGQSLFHPADEDSVFFLVRDLLAALERLAAAEGTARV